MKSVVILRIRGLDTMTVFIWRSVLSKVKVQGGFFIFCSGWVGFLFESSLFRFCGFFMRFVSGF